MEPNETRIEPAAPETEIRETTTPIPADHDAEIAKKEEIKANLDKAIVEANDTLRKAREEARLAKQGTNPAPEDVPQIDLNDPNSKAWDRHITEKTAPLSSQIEKQKEEVRTFALKTFLKSKPALAKNPEKLKELMTTYDRIKVASEQTQEGVLLDLDRAYGAVFHEEIIELARSNRIDQAKENMIYADIAIDRGATTETVAAPQKRQLSAEEQSIISQWEAHGAPKI